MGRGFESLLRYHPSLTSLPLRAHSHQPAKTRARGHAVSREESMVGVMSLGLPVIDQAASPVMVMQCPGLTESLAPREREVACASQPASARAHALLGSRAPPGFRFPRANA